DGGRSTFLRMRARTGQRLVSLLARKGRADEALTAARAARARMLREMERTERLESLNPAERERWEHAMGAYRRGREELDKEATDDWKLAAKNLEPIVTARRARQGRLREDLDAAFSTLSAPRGA